jgi:hypothetical protein
MLDDSQRTALAIQYLSKLDSVEGWLNSATAVVLVEILRLQEDLGCRGAIAEIGVHHGKSFLAMLAGANPHESAIAIDLFNLQDQNLGSGAGHLPNFQRNLATYFPDRGVNIITANSLEIAGRELEFGLTDLRFISIDGGHTRAITLNDLSIAATALADHGIACLDDVFNSQWPGVISGLFMFLSSNQTLYPFAYFPNKLFMCRPAFCEEYRRLCRVKFARALDWTDKELQDHLIDVYGEGGLLAEFLTREPAVRNS